MFWKVVVTCMDYLPHFASRVDFSPYHARTISKALSDNKRDRLRSKYVICFFSIQVYFYFLGVAVYQRMTRSFGQIREVRNSLGEAAVPLPPSSSSGSSRQYSGHQFISKDFFPPTLFNVDLILKYLCRNG